MRPPSSDDLVFNYEFSGSDDEVQYEIFELFNTSDARINLAGYSIAFESKDTLPIEDIDLIPKAELKIITYGSRSTQEYEDCLKYRHTRKNILDTPLFVDGETTVAILEPSGDQLLSKKFVTDNYNSDAEEPSIRV